MPYRWTDLRVVDPARSHDVTSRQAISLWWIALAAADETIQGGPLTAAWLRLFSAHLGFGARAVSGYLLDPDAALDDAGSTHAWAEVYLPGAGWIAFDPTHQRVGSANLVAVAVGRCNAQIMPISGGFVGAPEDFTNMEVRVSVRSL